MMDFIDRILDHLESNITLFSSFKVDILGEEENALTIRNIPSSPTTRFLNKTRDDEVRFQILVKHKDQSISIEKINEIVKFLEGLTTLESHDNSFKFIKCEVYTLPVFVEKNDRGSFIYSAIFRSIINI